MTTYQKIFFVLLFCYLSYSVMVYTLGTEVSSPAMTEQAVKGKLLWQKYNCIACHQLYGLGGYLGPDLTNEMSIRNEKVVEVFLRNGSGTMPNFNLSENEITALIEFLRYADQTGRFPNNNVKFDNFGSFNLTSDAN